MWPQNLQNAILGNDGEVVEEKRKDFKFLSMNNAEEWIAYLSEEGISR